MKRIPHDIDRLIWALAERQDPAALADFEARFPQYRHELRKRVRTVRALRETRAAHAGRAAIPTFELRPQPARPVALAAASGGAALAALAAAAFFLTVRLSPSPTGELTGVVRSQNAPLISSPAPKFADTEVERPFSARDLAPSAPAEAVPVAYDDPVDVRVQQQPLLAALAEVAEAGNLRLEVAPGFENPIVDVDVTGRDGFDALQKLGRQYGFTAFRQEPGVVLLIPAVDQATLAP